MSNILMEIAANKSREVENLKKTLPVDELIKQITTNDILDFKSAVSDKSKVNIIAEIKKVSPSKGVLTHDFNIGALAAKFREGGAAALSVLADEKYFHGSPRYIAIAKKSSQLPVLYKEFIVNSYQIYYARLMKADAVLLIIKLLNAKQLRDLREQAGQIGMAALVEIHDETELKIAVDSGAEIIGVNNRNLENFSVTLETSMQLGALIPKHIVKIAESGISDPAHIRQLKKSGFDGFLVGEALMKSTDPIKLLNTLRGA